MLSDVELGCSTESLQTQSEQPSQAMDRRWRGFDRIYYHPLTQIIMLGLVGFMCDGTFSAMLGLGAAGQADSATSSNAYSLLCVAMAVTAFFAGPINNVLGPRLTLVFGSIGYVLYVASYLTLSIHPKTGPFVVASGAVLGVSAALSWTAQSSLMLTYPTENQKGLFISIFWSMYNMGGVIGAIMPLGANFHSETASVGKGTYIAFLLLTSIGLLLPFLMADPKKMSRTDGSRLKVPSRPNWKSELLGFASIIKTDPYILSLFPMFLASNWYLTWQMNDYNGALFNIRARSLNNLIYWIAQIPCSFFVGRLLDIQRVRRRVRAFTGWAVLFTIVWVVHIWAYFYQKDYTRESITTASSKIDIYDPPYVGRALLYILFAVMGATWQITSYWILGALSNDPSKLAYFTGLHTAVQSTGSAIAWRIDALKVPFMSIFLSTWVLVVVGLLFALPVLHWRITDQTEFTTTEHPSEIEMIKVQALQDSRSELNLLQNPAADTLTQTKYIYYKQGIN